MVSSTSSGETEASWEAFEAELSRLGLSPTKLRKTVRGLVMEPVYGAQHLPSGQPTPAVRGWATEPAWLIRSPVAAGSVDDARRQALSDLQRGAHEVLFVLEPRLRGAGARWTGGVELLRPSDFRSVIRDIQLDLAGAHLEPGVAWLPTGLGLLRAFEKSETAGEAIKGGLGADPIASWVRHGALPGPWAEIRKSFARLAHRCVERFPKVKPGRIDVAIWPEVGADVDLELGCGLSHIIELARIFDDQGIAPASVLGRMELRLAAGPDVFETVCKFRAFRRGLERIFEALGSPEALTHLSVEAMPLTSMFTRRDLPTNHIRLAASTIGAAMGGAHSIIALPYDHAAHGPEESSRRLARNLQVMLQEESRIGHVADPAGGSYYVEARTAQMAEAGWAAMQQVEREGGLVQSLLSGQLQERVNSQRLRLRERIARRQVSIVGVSEYPNLEVDEGLESRFEESQRIVEGPSWGAFEAADFDKALAEVSDVQDILRPDGGERFDAMPALRRFRWATDFEVLRDQSDRVLSATGRRPQVYLAALGAPKDHGGRVSWMTNLLAAGGLEAVVGPPEKIAEAGCALCVLCGRDEDYAASGADAVRALSAGGARWIGLAGAPPEALSSYIQASVRLGDDVLAFLNSTWRQLEDEQ
ncbi:MAG: methylmalonyl-CoA mutase family protein [Myxococcota bacterium]